MATEKANAEVSQTPSSSTQDNSTNQSENSKQSATPYFGKALAHRALYGSGSRSSGSRKERKRNSSHTLKLQLRRQKSLHKVPPQRVSSKEREIFVKVMQK
ncbi:hypothetical protein SO802_033363 [Lithocarpus litseifolius]|uniref:Uncharacterized protein n=1 Tax=Lithocarpus litseifolius TaxID=425828 RepID=A0AAW2BEJ7_9ROSI